LAAESSAERTHSFELAMDNTALAASFLDLRQDLRAALAAHTVSTSGIKTNRKLQAELEQAESVILKIRTILESTSAPIEKGVK